MERGTEHVIETGTSISGIPHIGNASDVIRGDAIRKVLLERGIEVDFIWIADDSDPFRKIPKGMENLEGYLGYPVIDIPDFEGCHSNFVEHFVEPFLSDLAEFGVKPRVYSATELYRKNEFEREIKTILNRSREIVEILNRFRREPLSDDTIFWNPICENCGRISTTKAIKMNDTEVHYVCRDVVLSGVRVRGCDYRGVSDVKKGMGKLPWRIEWAVRWKHFRVTCEPLGKEHASSGGSFWTSNIICKEILNYEPPLPVIYEFFTLNGEKISSSKGNVITLSDWLKICEPEVLKFFMYKRLTKQRDIKLSAIPNLVDEYDSAERVYFNLEEGDDELKRMYELSQINKPELLQIPFTLCVVLSQIVPDLDIDKIVKRLRNMGYRNFSKVRLERRLRFAREWNSRYGPEYLQFRVIDEDRAESIKEKLNENELNALKKIADELDKEWKPKELHKRIYEIARGLKIKPENLFKIIYLVLIGKEKGPKAAMFLLSLDRNLVKRRFK